MNRTLNQIISDIRKKDIEKDKRNYVWCVAVQRLVTRDAHKLIVEDLKIAEIASELPETY